MQLRKNLHSVALMRTHYTPVDWLDDQTKVGGYSTPIKIATIRRDAVDIPPAVRSLLTDDEIELVVKQVIDPARLRAQQLASQRAAELAEQQAILTDPNHFLGNALESLREAHEHSEVGDRSPKMELTASALRQCAEIALLGAARATNCQLSTADVLSALGKVTAMITCHILSDSFPPSGGDPLIQDAIAVSWKGFREEQDRLRSALQKKKFARKRR